MSTYEHDLREYLLHEALRLAKLAVYTNAGSAKFQANCSELLQSTNVTNTNTLVDAVLATARTMPDLDNARVVCGNIKSPSYVALFNLAVTQAAIKLNTRWTEQVVHRQCGKACDLVEARYDSKGDAVFRFRYMGLVETLRLGRKPENMQHATEHTMLKWALACLLDAGSVQYYPSAFAMKPEGYAALLHASDAPYIKIGPYTFLSSTIEPDRFGG